MNLVLACAMRAVALAQGPVPVPAGPAGAGDAPAVPPPAPPAPEGTFTAVWTWAADPNHAVALAITAGAILVAILVATVVARRVTRSISDEVRRHKARRAIAYIAQFLALLVIALVWAGQLNWQLWFGLVSVGLALALQRAILCLAGWFLITLRHPFEVGDRIQVGTLIGDVIDVRLFHTYLLEVGNWVDADQSTGRVVHMPNSVVFTQPVMNYTQGFPYIWNEIPILVTFESDWRRAKALLEAMIQDESRDITQEVARFISRMKRDYPIRYQNLTPIVYTSVRDSGVLLTIRYLTHVRDRRQTAAELCELILDAFAREPQVTFAYPTYRMFRGTGLAPAAGRPGGAASADAWSGEDEEEGDDGL